jgi:hypothetical protein
MANIKSATKPLALSNSKQKRYSVVKKTVILQYFTVLLLLPPLCCTPKWSPGQRKYSKAFTFGALSSMQVLTSPFDDEKYMKKKKSVNSNESLTRRCRALVQTSTFPHDICTTRRYVQ